jgi:asparagine synthase (glutamine-hydrolysing)
MSYLTVFSADVRDQLLGERSGEDTPEPLRRYFARFGGADALHQNIYVDLKTSLADDLLALTDKASMAASIECRAPFMDQELVELCGRMPSNLKVRGRTLKYLLKKVVEPWLPAEIIHRKKRGFGAPIGAWLRRDLASMVEDALSPEQIRARGLFDPAVVQQVIAAHVAGRSDHTDHLLALISLELWCRTFVDSKPHAMPVSAAVPCVQ